ncbi:hypothetical protein GY45DRAFT_33226 [Cubamyces sp. BRFM 1775]|nr:hypothetical protein GY45DRAFT_33226 [Cubamyces sp. BRFM 1775]
MSSQTACNDAPYYTDHVVHSSIQPPIELACLLVALSSPPTCLLEAYRPHTNARAPRDPPHLSRNSAASLLDAPFLLPARGHAQRPLTSLATRPACVADCGLLQQARTSLLTNARPCAFSALPLHTTRGLLMPSPQVPATRCATMALSCLSDAHRLSSSISQKHRLGCEPRRPSGFDQRWIDTPRVTASTRLSQYDQTRLYQGSIGCIAGIHVHHARGQAGFEHPTTPLAAIFR